MYYKDRAEAGQKLAEALKAYQNRDDVIVLGLARGGVIIAAEIGRALSLPFDLIMVRKIGAPSNPELAIGAITESGKGFFNEELIHALNVPQDYLEAAIQSEQALAQKRLALYRKNRSPPELKGKRVILVDDGIATGATMIAAVRSTRERGAKEVVIAIPVAPPDTLKRMESVADELICLFSTDDFQGISQFYAIFPQIEDDEIIKLLE
ncbi:MAG: putative phosphoribosyl transferase [Chlamydiae bacterium]|nr:putative phosphoribosyl transferase [Chlamydiota bacterium]